MANSLKCMNNRANSFENLLPPSLGRSRSLQHEYPEKMNHIHPEELPTLTDKKQIMINKAFKPREDPSPTRERLRPGVKHYYDGLKQAEHRLNHKARIDDLNSRHANQSFEAKEEYHLLGEWGRRLADHSKKKAEMIVTRFDQLASTTHHH